MIFGNNSLDKKMSTFWFGILTFVIILIFILLENKLRNSLEILSLIGGGAMFIMSMLFVLLAGLGFFICCTYGAASSAPDMAKIKSPVVEK